jgi:FkbM family methyltransferase
MIVADVGANIGIYTEFFGNIVGSGGEVHAFEPHPVNFRLLSNALSSFDRIFLNQSAVGGDDQDIFLYISRSLNVDHRTYEHSEERDKILVPCVTLDDYFNDGKSVDFIKIDIQGYEYHALSGMTRVLHDNNQLKILMEYFPYGLEASGCSGSILRTFLMERGFLLYSITSKGNLLALNGREPRLNSLGYANIFAQRC